MPIAYIIAFLLIAAVIIYYMFFAKGKNKKEEFKKDRSTTQEHRDRDFTIENVGPEGKISLTNFGENNEFLNITITDKTRHHEGDNFWYELEGETSHGHPFWLQIEAINPYKLNGGTEEVDFNLLGISTRDLEEFRVKDQAFTLEEDQFYFESGGEAQMYTSEAEDDEDFRWYRYWNFATENDEIYLTVQQLEDSTPEATVSYPIESNQLKIFELGIDVE